MNQSLTFTRSMLTLTLVTGLLTMTTRLTAAEKTFANVVRCDATTGNCDADLAISGSSVSSIILSGITGAPISVVFFPGEKGEQAFGPCPAPGGTFKIVVDKRRQLLPTWVTHIGHRLSPPAGPPMPTCADPRVILEARTPDLTFAVGARSYTVLVRHQRWWLESGGFYAFSWARDEELVTVTETISGASKTRIVDIRQGDRIGPVTGVTFVFHPADYPEYGWEFGTATSGGRTHYYLGGTVRLIQFNDRALLTVGAGLSHVSVKQFPNLTLTNGDGTTRYFDTNDPLLTGITHYVNKPYISLGLGINLGGPSAARQ